MRMTPGSRLVDLPLFFGALSLDSATLGMEYATQCLEAYCLAQGPSLVYTLSNIVSGMIELALFSFQLILRVEVFAALNK